MTSLDQPEEKPPLPSTEETPELPGETEDVSEDVPENPDEDALKTLKYSLLGPSLLKAGQDKVDQSKVCPNLASLLGIINTESRSLRSSTMPPKDPSSLTAKRSATKSSPGRSSKSLPARPRSKRKTLLAIYATLIVSSPSSSLPVT